MKKEQNNYNTWYIFIEIDRCFISECAAFSASFAKKIHVLQNPVSMFYLNFHIVLFILQRIVPDLNSKSMDKIFVHEFITQLLKVNIIPNALIT